jgi:hypothetical protein
MGTRNNPGKYDCYYKAAPDEPIFVLLGRDPVASVVVRFWIQMRKLIGGTQQDKLDEALRCARYMEDYAIFLDRDNQSATRAMQATATDDEITEDDMVRACRITAGNIARTGPGAMRELAREFAEHGARLHARVKSLETKLDAIRDILAGQVR